MCTYLRRWLICLNWCWCNGLKDEQKIVSSLDIYTSCYHNLFLPQELAYRLVLVRARELGLMLAILEK